METATNNVNSRLAFYSSVGVKKCQLRSNLVGMYTKNLLKKNSSIYGTTKYAFKVITYINTFPILHTSLWCNY